MLIACNYLSVSTEDFLWNYLTPPLLIFYAFFQWYEIPYYLLLIYSMNPPPLLLSPNFIFYNHYIMWLIGRLSVLPLYTHIGILKTAGPTMCLSQGHVSEWFGCVMWLLSRHLDLIIVLCFIMDFSMHVCIMDVCQCVLSSLYGYLAFDQFYHFYSI